MIVIIITDCHYAAMIALIFADVDIRYAVLMLSLSVRYDAATV